VAEADESDRSFLKLPPILAVVTNLDREHMDCYRDMDDVEHAFLAFMDKVPFYGAVTACIDNAALAAILPRVHRRVFTYGLAPEADYRLKVLPAKPESFSHFEVITPAGTVGPYQLHVPGRHNALNATAAVAIAHQLGVATEKIAAGISSFRGVDRRFQIRGQARGITVVDDYGHHPTEIRATLAAAREFSKGRIHVVFQPHRYTRTRDLLDEFGAAFEDADSVVVLPIYAASEEPLPGITAELLTSKITSPPAQYAPGFNEAVAAVVRGARTGDMILTLGAGSVSQLGPQILTEIESAK
jgi:UDP-N-acetylmuramate--alanine ligase